MFCALVVDLLQSYEALDQACREFAASVREDEDLPLVLPTYDGRPGGEREAAIAAIIQLWHLEPGETLVEAGLLCASEKTVAAANHLNDAKDAFQAAVKAIRDAGPQGEKSRLDKLVDRVLHQEGRRTEDLALALKRARINRLDLLRCYAKVRILPKHLDSLSWTWAKTHSSIVQVSMEEALKMARNLAMEETKETALSLLSQLPPGEVLAYKKKLPNQLRANLVWTEEGERKRKAVTISGVVLSQDATLPRYLWRDNPEHAEPDTQQVRLSRDDAGIESEPYIKALRLHRYVGGRNVSE
ncbi:MAG: hypothetical protein G8D89_01790 [gamma proteobacterium symbiont of Clathrolucina costata]